MQRKQLEDVGYPAVKGSLLLLTRRFSVFACS